MELSRIIQNLYRERTRLDVTLKTLESLQASSALATAEGLVVERRGRKNMGTAERRQVSERMKRYWAERRIDTRGQDVTAVAVGSAAVWLKWISARCKN